MRGIERIDRDRGGEIHGLIGPNGAGKTSLINAISGMVLLSRGGFCSTVGNSKARTASRIAAAGVGRTFQHAEIFDDQTVLENVTTGAYQAPIVQLVTGFAGTPAKARAERQIYEEAEKLLAAFNLFEFRLAQASELPFGILKKVDLIRALMTRPRVLMLDEPTSGMDGVEAQELIRTCRRIVEELGVTMLVIEHNMRVIMRLARTIHVLDHGEKISRARQNRYSATLASLRHIWDRSTPMLDLVDLRAGYNRIDVLRSVSITVPRGAFVGLLGPNGAGKTTLMRSISGFTRVHSGDIRFEGHSLRGMTPEIIVDLGIIHVPQGRKLFPD